MRNINSVRSILILLSVIVVLAVYGYISCYGYTFDDAIYKTLQLFTIGSGTVPEKSFAVNLARFLAPIIVVFGGVQLVYSISQNGWKQFCLWTFKKHAIICGYGITGTAFYEKLKGKQIIVIDPMIKKSKVSISEIFLNKDASDRSVLLNEAKIDKASEIIIATGSDYINILIYDIAKDFHNISSIKVRLEQLVSPDIPNYSDKNRINFFNLSETVVSRFMEYENQLIIVLGIGSVGKRIVNRYKNTNKILVIEQSVTAIHMAQDFYNSSNIRYERGDVKGLVENDMINILEKYSLRGYHKAILFICLGGDWLGFSTAWKWLSWTKIVLDINVVGININKELLSDRGENHIYVENIRETIL